MFRTFFIRVFNVRLKFVAPSNFILGSKGLHQLEGGRIAPRNRLLRFRWKEHLFNRPEQPIFYLERVLSFVVLLTSAWYYFLHSTNLLRNSTDLRQIDRNFLSIVLDQCESVVSMNRHFEGYVYDHLSI